MMTNNLSLYIHIPFCLKKCDYCAFYSLPDQGEEVKQKYFEALKRQINFFSDEREIYSVYFGGGTPPLIGIERLCELLRLISTNFKLKSDCEITVEVNPETVDYPSLLKLRDAGANRLSVGIQSSDDRVLKDIGRIHTFKRAKDCISDARKAGFNNISVDIIFALPNQTDETFEKVVFDIMSTNPDHISAYSLQIEEGTPLFKKRDSLEFPDEDREEKQYDILCRLLSENGFVHYEVSSFAKSGFRSRHNYNYWARGEYFGFGAAAHSFYGGKRFSAVADVNSYISETSSLFSATDYYDQEVISENEAETERIMLGLRTSDGTDIPEKAISVAERIAKLGYGVFENGKLKLNGKGFRVSNEIIYEIAEKL